MNATILHQQAEKLRNEAGSRRQQATGYANHAVQYSQENDYTRAQVQQDQADRLNKEIRELEDKAVEYERQAKEKEDQARKLDEERLRLQQSIEAIDKEKEKLLGGSGIISIL